jgi:hypothetical protein
MFAFKHRILQYEAIMTHYIWSSSHSSKDQNLSSEAQVQ